MQSPKAEKLVFLLAEDVPQESEATVSNVERFLNTVENGALVREAYSSPLSVMSVTWLTLWVLHNGFADVGRDQNGQFCFQGGEWHRSAVRESAHGSTRHLISIHDGEYARVSAFVRQKLSDKREFKTEFFQNRESEQSLVRRFRFMQSFGDDHPGRLLLLGDDAFFSVFFASCGFASEICVLDIDPDLVGALNSIFLELGMSNARAIVYDVRKPLPPELVGSFDRFFVSGLKDIGGLLLFIGRGLEALDELGHGRAGYFIYGSHAFDSEAERDYILKIQRWLTQFDCAISSIVPCVDTWPTDDFFDSLLSVVREALHKDEWRDSWEAVKAGMLRLPKIYPDEGWLQMKEFPFLNLKPVPAARLCPPKALSGSLKRYLGMVGRGGFSGSVDS